MKPGRNRRRYLVAAGTLALMAILGLWLARVAVAGLAFEALLRLVGASEIKCRVVSASPWRVVAEDVDFQIRARLFAARRITFTRQHWWSPSLGTLRIEHASTRITVDDSDTDPLHWSTYHNGTAAIAPAQLPFEEISLEGEVVVGAAALTDRVLSLTFHAHPGESGRWSGQIAVTGPGLECKGAGSYDRGKDELTFQLPEVSLDLREWRGFIQRVVLLPGGAWEMEGRLDGNAAGRITGRKLVAHGKVRLRDGRVRYPQRDIDAAGVEADLEFTDLDKFRTAPGVVRVRELRTGQLSCRDIMAELAFAGPNKIAVSGISLNTLGGRATAEPFSYYLDQREIGAVVRLDGADLAALMALTRDVPARVTGRVDGRLPLEIDGSGLRLGTGWLALSVGIPAWLQVGRTGHRNLRLQELRLEIRPRGLPGGYSAHLHLAREADETPGGALVTVDVDIKGPLEKFVDLGMDSSGHFRVRP